jgi:hypothetical protein
MANLSSAVRTLVKYPRFTLMRSIARFDLVRRVAVQAQRTMREPMDRYVGRLRSRKSEFFAAVDPEALVATVERDGFALGLTLPPGAVQELVEFARNNHCWADRDPRLGFTPERIDEARSRIGRRFLLAHYFNVRRRCAVASRLSQDPVLGEIAARYLGTVPKLVGTALWWSYPEQADASSRNHAAQMFHFDLDDFKFIKFFFYLTDVDETAGPHVVVRGTHGSKGCLRQGREALAVRRYTDEEIEAVYGRERIVRITGQAGTGFIEDTLCIHKGAPPTGRERLVFQLQYALNDFGNQTDDIEDAKLEVIA